MNNDCNTIEYIKPINYRSKNENVSKIQEYINWFYYLNEYNYQIKVDGNFGIVTKKALEYISSSHNIYYKDIVNPNLIKILQTPLINFKNINLNYKDYLYDLQNISLGYIVKNYLNNINSNVFYNIENNYMFNNSGGPLTRFLLHYNTNLNNIHNNAIFVTYILNKLNHELNKTATELNLKPIDFNIIQKLFYINKNFYIFNKHFLELIKKAKQHNILHGNNYIPKPGDIFIEIDYNNKFLHTGFVHEVDLNTELTFTSLEHLLINQGKSLVYRNRYIYNYSYISLNFPLKFI